MQRTGKINYAACKAQQPKTRKLIDQEGKELVPDVCKWDVTKIGQLNFKAVGKTKEQESQWPSLIKSCCLGTGK